MLATALLESFSVFSVGFFFSSLLINSFELPSFLLFFYKDISELDKNLVIQILGILTLVIFLSTLTFSFLNNFFLIFFTENLSKNLKNDFFSFYLDQNILFHKKFPSSFLIKNLTNDLDRISSGLVLPALRIISKFSVLILMFITLTILRPMETITLGISLVATYFLIFVLLKKFLTYFGRLISVINEQRVRIIQESLLGIKDIILNKMKSYFLEPFKELNSKYLKLNILYSISNFFPRFIIDSLLFSVIILTIIYVNNKSSNNLNNLISTLIVLGFGAYRIIPIIQDIYNSFMRIRGNAYVIKIFGNDFQNLLKLKNKKILIFKSKSIINSIKLKKVNFKYNYISSFNLKAQNLNIEIGKKTAIVGKSGSGKSTLLEILLGLIINKNIKVLFDNQHLSQKYFDKNRFNISYVSQNSYVLDENIFSNIMMIDNSKLDYKKISHDTLLNDLLKNLELDFDLDKKHQRIKDYRLGEGGSKLSGGQRQRLAIARAIYKQNEILVLDEATSSLDINTEKKILNYVYQLDFIKTVIFITHKLRNVKDYDSIILMDEGKVVDIGKYDYLYKNQEKFRKLID